MESGNWYSYSNGLSDDCGCGGIPSGVFAGRGCRGDTGVEIEGTVSAGDVDVSMSMGNRPMSKVSGLAWKRDWP